MEGNRMLFKNKKILKWITYIFGSAIAPGKKIVLKFVVFVIFNGFDGQMYLFQVSKYTYEPPKYTYDKLYLWGHILPHHPWRWESNWFELSHFWGFVSLLKLKCVTGFGE